MKRLLCVLCVLCAVLLLVGCGQAADAPEPWNVTIEQVDLNKPENRQYIDWFEEKDAEPDVKPDPWSYVWEDDENKTLREKYQPWSGTTELVIQYTPALATEATWDDETSYRVEFLARSKATKETQLISEGHWSYLDWATGVIYTAVDILSDTQIFYEKNDYCADCGDSCSYYLYDRETGKSTLVADPGLAGGGLHYQDDMRYLSFGWEGDRTCLYQIDLRKLIAGKQDAKRLICRLDSFGYIEHISQDRRFVYLRRFDNDYNCYPHREIYNIDSGERVAEFQLPVHDYGYSNYDTLTYSALIDDATEYFYSWNMTELCVVRYER